MKTFLLSKNAIEMHPIADYRCTSRDGISAKKCAKILLLSPWQTSQKMPKRQAADLC
jgi:hypothetical protein